MMAALVLVAPVLALLQPPAGLSDVALVVLPPWADRSAVVAALDGAALGPGRAPFAVLVQTSQAHWQGGLDAGAWWIADGSAVAMICGVTA